MIAILIVFFILCFVSGTNTAKIILGSLEAVMSYTVGPLAKHFFPAFTKAIKPSSPKIAKPPKSTQV
jgi:hypothetical protein